jgi:hypothetical protein
MRLLAVSWPGSGVGASGLGYPLIVFFVSLFFGVAVFRQYLSRRRPYQLAWCASLGSAALGSLAYVVFLAADKSELAFRLYYVFGALLTAPLLGLGSLLLIARGDRARERVRIIVYVVVVGSLVGTLLLLINPVNASVLRQLNGGPGTDPDVYKSGPWLVFLIVLNIFGALAVIGVALYSGWNLWRRNGSGRLVGANALIALGTIVISQAGGMARSGFGAGAFWLTMTVGWVVLFGGFLLTFNMQRDGAVAAARTAPAAL